MGVLLMSEDVHPRTDTDNNNERGIRDANQTDVAKVPSPPKKKWIRHYLLEEDPLETRTNGNYSTATRRSPALSNTSRGTPPASNSGHVAMLHASHPHPHHQNNHDGTHNHYLDNHNTNNSQSLVVDVETPGYDNKKPRNGPCMIRSGTREVHNKLEKNRRAHLKECFELLKRQLPTQDEKKSSNLSILHAAIRHIQTLKKKERDMEHEMERLAREKIASQQRIVALKKELAATWDHIDFSTLLPEQNNSTDNNTVKNEPMEVDVSSLARGGTRYSSTSSLSSAATASSPQNLQASNVASSIHSQAATAAVVCQTQGLNIAQGSRESPPASSSPGSSTPSIPTPAQEKVSSPSVVQTQMTSVSGQQHTSSQQSQQPQSHQLHLPINAQMLNTTQGLATIVPTLQHIGPGMRLVGDTRQLLVTHATGNNECRPLIAVQSNTGNEARPVALVVQSSTANDNRVTFVHSNLSNNERPLALAVQSSASEVRPVTFVHSGNEGRPLVLAAHPPALNATNTQTRIRTTDAQTTHKMVGGVTLVGGNGSELTRLPGGAELNILPANGVFRSVKAQPLAVQGGLTLSHAGVSLQPNATKPGSTVVQSAPSTEGIAHIVGQHAPLSGLTPIVTPMTVVSQGNQVTAHILAPSSLAGKVLTTPILKPVGQMPLVNAQYLNTLVKPVVVVTSPSSAPTTTSTTSAQSPPPPSQSQSSSNVHSSV